MSAGRAISTLAVAFSLALPGAAGATAARPISGTFALAGAHTSLAGYLVVRPMGETGAQLDYWQRRDGRTVRSYATEMTKPIHLIVVARNFSTFAHLHPTLDPATGHFRIALHVPTPGAYDVYADTTPAGQPQSVFRFPITLGTLGSPGSMRASMPGAFASTTIARTGPYVVRLDRDVLEAGRESRLVARIASDGRPARDLRSYLGAAAHVVLIDTRTRDYVHVHPEPPGTPDSGPMDMSHGMAAMETLPAGAAVDPTMDLHVDLADPGRYRMWLQFRGRNGLNVAPFSLTATPSRAGLTRRIK